MNRFPAEEAETVALDFVDPLRGPVGTAWPLVGRHGSMKPGGWRTGDGVGQRMRSS